MRLYLLEYNLKQLQKHMEVAFGRDIMKYSFDEHLKIMEDFQRILSKVRALKEAHPQLRP